MKSLLVTMLLLAAYGCSSEQPQETESVGIETLHGAIARGDDCPELFAIRNEIDPKSDDYEQATPELQSVGCTHASATREDDIAAGPWTGMEGLEVPPSSACVSAMEEAAAETESSVAEPLLEDTLTACDSVDEWLSAVKAEPAAMGVSQGVPIGRIEVQSACFKYQSTPVCSDARSRGIEF